MASMTDLWHIQLKLVRELTYLYKCLEDYLIVYENIMMQLNIIWTNVSKAQIYFTKLWKRFYLLQWFTETKLSKLFILAIFHLSFQIWVHAMQDQYIFKLYLE